MRNLQRTNIFAGKKNTYRSAYALDVTVLMNSSGFFNQFYVGLQCFGTERKLISGCRIRNRKICCGADGIQENFLLLFFSITRNVPPSHVIVVALNFLKCQMLVNFPRF